MDNTKTKLTEKEALHIGSVSCRFCKHFKFDSEYDGLGSCDNNKANECFVYGHADMFLLDADFGCKFYISNGN